jgi:hypothetical protein
MYGGIAGGAVGGVIAIVGVIVAVYFLRRRWRSRRDYLRSLKRYTERFVYFCSNVYHAITTKERPQLLTIIQRLTERAEK